ncbi:hypothetical protein IB270_24080 [Ensifer sp. ENS05]|uniref:hypothetical protein n=1 Tax=Ensifer sp. ENS05 TaxID=2769277 RepID=UPI00177C1078|nr:hypothetical protein [Ensifer sp. ENS05]MBD9595934.1 hypothetical protein [Ensifer sp. ENS05]
MIVTLRGRKHARGLNPFYARVSCLVKVSDVAIHRRSIDAPVVSQKTHLWQAPPRERIDHWYSDANAFASRHSDIVGASLIIE